MINIKKFQNPENWWLQTINMSGATYAYPIPEKKKWIHINWVIF